MEKLVFYCSFLLVSVITQAQTGPGGVGSSSSNVLWLAADKGVTLNGTQVASWADQSGNGNNVDAPTTTAQPTYTLNAVNGFPCFTFDGTEDQLQAPDQNSLDIVKWDIFVVGKANLLKSYNAWISKGNDNNENFEVLSSNIGVLYGAIRFTDNGRDAGASSNSQVTTTNYDVFEYSYINTVGRDMYKNNVSIGTDNQYRTPRVNALPLVVGNEANVTGRFLNGNIAEIVIFNDVLNTAQRIIVNNYLAAKYGRPLGSSDCYTMDDSGNGNFDYDVAGIGRTSSTESQVDSKGTGIVRIFNATDLGDNEFYIWGHNNLSPVADEISDVPPGIEGRLFRVWRGSEVNTSGTAVDVGTVDIEFDLTGKGDIRESDLRLLIDLNNNGVFSDDLPVTGAVSMGNNLYQFQGISGLADGLRFTLGTVDRAQTPLPVELVAFEIAKVDRELVAQWEISYEEDVKHYRIERTTDLNSWTLVGTVPAQGLAHYQFLDPKPLEGTSYYRLSSIDNDLTVNQLGVRAVEFNKELAALVTFPNPVDDAFVVVLDKTDRDQFRVVDQLGKDVTALLEMEWISDSQLFVRTSQLVNGVYYLTTASAAACIVLCRK